MTFLYAMLVFLPALASLRPLNTCEAYACQCLYGTGDVEKLVAIERDPVRFWHEREADLTTPGATITHAEFCKKFVEEAKGHIAQNCRASKGKRFFRDGEGVDEALHNVLSEDDAAWPTTQAFFYATACDNLPALERKIQSHHINAFLRACAGCLTEEFNTKQLWLAEPCREFAIVDSLIIHRQGKYLSSAVIPEKRSDFVAHPACIDGFFAFEQWRGVIEHDCLAHASRQYRRACALKKNHDISETDHFNMYCSPERIVPGNLITQSQQHLGWFYNGHELPSFPYSYDPMKLESLLFPYEGELTDRGFKKIVPFFVLNSADWKNVGFGYDADLAYFDKYCHKTLLEWRNTYCWPGQEIAPLSYFTERGSECDAKVRMQNHSVSWYLVTDPERALAPSAPGLYIFIKSPRKAFRPHSVCQLLDFTQPLIKASYVPVQGQKQEVLIKGGVVRTRIFPKPMMVRVFAQIDEIPEESRDVFVAKIPAVVFSYDIIDDNKVRCEDKPPFKQTFAYPLPYNTKLQGEKPYMAVTTSDQHLLQISTHAQDRGPETFCFFESIVSVQDRMRH